MNAFGSWLLRLVGAILVAALALRVAVELVRPIVGWLLAAAVPVGLLVAIRWWRNNRW